MATEETCSNQQHKRDRGSPASFRSPEGERHGNVAELKSKTKQEKAGQLIPRLSQRGSALALPRLQIKVEEVGTRKFRLFVHSPKGEVESTGTNNN